MSAKTWAYVSNYFVYSSMVVYTLAFFSHAYETAWSVRNPDSADKTEGNLLTKTLDFTKTEKVARIATAMMILGFLLLFGGVITRGLSNQHVPWGNMYEFSITGALAFTGAYLVALRKYDLRWLGLFISLAVLLTLGTAITLLYRDSAPLVPALKSTWLVIHVIAAIISGGVFLLANVISGAYLYLDYKESRDGRPIWLQRVPSLEVLDQLSYRLVAFVFPLWTFAVIAGAIWADADKPAEHGKEFLEPYRPYWLVEQPFYLG